MHTHKQKDLKMKRVSCSACEVRIEVNDGELEMCGTCRIFYLEQIALDSYDSLVCENRNKCKITVKTKTQCKKCWFDKCVVLGSNGSKFIMNLAALRVDKFERSRLFASNAFSSFRRYYNVTLFTGPKVSKHPNNAVTDAHLSNEFDFSLGAFRRISSFAMSFNEFKNLTIKSKLAVLSDTCLTIMMLQASPRLNVADMSLLLPNFEIVPKARLEEVLGPLFNEFMWWTTRLNQLKLSYAEFAYLQTACLFYRAKSEFDFTNDIFPDWVNDVVMKWIFNIMKTRFDQDVVMAEADNLITDLGLLQSACLRVSQTLVTNFILTDEYLCECGCGIRFKNNVLGIV